MFRKIVWYDKKSRRILCGFVFWRGYILKKIKRKISSFQLILFGFSGVILIGTFLLMLPVSSAAGTVTSFSDALFTATSATCVTGLVVVDTATHWSYFGQAVLLLLIQIGGLGIITVALSIAYFSGRKIGLVARSTMRDSISAPRVGGIVRLTRFILRGVFLIELLGFLLLLCVFCPRMGAKGIWPALFHSVSAFCNAGFDLCGTTAPFSSLTGFSADTFMNIVIMLLIMVGGIGFLVWEDVVTHKFHWKKYRLQSKLVLLTSLLLILLPAIWFYCFDFAHLPQKERLLAALFHSVSTRTAGMNTVDLSSLGGTGLLLTDILMLIGGSPGSTAGGMKTTTPVVLLLSSLAVFRRKDRVECFGRELDDGTVKTAAAILMMYLILFFTGGVIISTAEALPLSMCLFETASGVGTVGLTLGITPSLGHLSRGILIFLMFFGRVGGLTLFFAATKPSAQVSQKPQEKITVG